MSDLELSGLRRDEEFDEILLWLTACREHSLVRSALLRARGLLH